MRGELQKRRGRETEQGESESQSQKKVIQGRNGLQMMEDTNKVPYRDQHRGRRRAHHALLKAGSTQETKPVYTQTQIIPIHAP
jgi:hypothetical protein